MRMGGVANSNRVHGAEAERIKQLGPHSSSGKLLMPIHIR
jgi:hypothetical protein